MQQRFRLAGPEGDGRHPYINETGAFIGRGAALVEAEPDTIGRARFRPRPVAQLNALLPKGYGGPIDCARLEGHLRAVAKALNDGDLARAAIALLHANLPPLPDEAAAERLAKADRELRARLAECRKVRVAVAKANYNPGEPRIPKGQPGAGQWTADGGQAQMAEAGEQEKSSMGPHRGMTPGEVALAQSLFGCRIDYGDVTIRHRRYYTRQPAKETVTPGNDMYFPEDSPNYRSDFSNSTEGQGHFIHKLTHVLQTQAGEILPIRVAFNPADRIYGYTLDGRKEFKDYGIEQQAAIVEDYFRRKYLGERPSYAEGNQPALEDYERVLQVDDEGAIRAPVSSGDKRAGCN